MSQVMVTGTVADVEIDGQAVSVRIRLDSPIVRFSQSTVREVTIHRSVGQWVDRIMEPDPPA
jgi:hypothetical protein